MQGKHCFRISREQCFFIQDIHHIFPRPLHHTFEKECHAVLKAEPIPFFYFFIGQHVTLCIALRRITCTNRDKFLRKTDEYDITFTI